MMANYNSTQTAWEETEEEIRKRIEASQLNQHNWWGTLMGLAVMAGTLVFLLSIK